MQYHDFYYFKICEGREVVAKFRVIIGELNVPGGLGGGGWG